MIEMSSRFMLSVAGAATAAALVLPLRAAADPGQQASSRHIVAHPTTRPCSGDVPRKKATAFNPPRTADGRPDFRGYWRHGTEAKEDLEVPWDNRARVGAGGKVPAAGPGKSLIVDPTDGKLPLQPWAEAQKRENEASYIDQNTLCFLSGVPRFMYESGGLPDSAGCGVHHDPVRGGARVSRHRYGRPSAYRKEYPALAGRRAWQVGGQPWWSKPPIRAARAFLDRRGNYRSIRTPRP